MSINTITITGHVGRDPESRQFDNGTMVVSVPLAVRQQKRGGEERPPIWVEVAFWNKLAMTAGDYIVKGSQSGVTGRLEEPDVWIDKKTGEARSKVKITASSLELIKRPDDAAPAQRTQPAQAQAAANNWAEELPF